MPLVLSDIEQPIISASRTQIPVVIVVPPFAEVVSPSLGPSLLAVACRKRSIPSVVFYASLHFASQIGFSLYQSISSSSSGEEMIGDAIFRGAAFYPEQMTDDSCIREIFKTRDYINTYGIDGKKIVRDEILKSLSFVPLFLDEVVAKILALQPRIVGFSSSFQQTLSSIAIARRLKEKSPDIVTVLGGANAASPMGKGLLEITSAFDFVFSGESDLEFPSFCQAYLDENRLPENPIVECGSIQEMDLTETPNYEDYLQQLSEYQQKNLLPKELPSWLYFETSRGCWWGAKSHCTFCGLNALDMAYRRKSTKRILEDIYLFKTKYQAKHLRAVDNIMPYEFHQDVLPALSEQQPKIKIFYEVKSNLKERDLDLFVTAGVKEVQPGVESLSSNILKLVGKGVSGIQNLWLLKNCLARGIYVYWNMLAGVPGETRADYEGMLQIFPFIEHLQAPEGWGFIRLDRFSPYHSYSEKYGIVNVRPTPGYARIYPPSADLYKIAYYFQGDYDTNLLKDSALQKKVGDA
ncbi:MAG: RiPP maturation radical SAM C-methyltransferase, partial [Planctomycetota bacterium]